MSAMPETPQDPLTKRIGDLVVTVSYDIPANATEKEKAVRELLARAARKQKRASDAQD